MRDLIRSLASNQIFTGLAGSMAMGSLIFLLRAIPTKLFWLLYDAFTVTLVVTNDDSIYDYINEWFADHEYSQRARRLKVATRRRDGAEYALAPGLGRHYMWDHGPVMLDRVIEDKQGGNYRLHESYHITTFGRSQARVRQLIEQANAQRRDADMLGIRMWHGYWHVLPAKPKRSLDTVYLDPAVKQTLLDDLEWFLANRALFVRLGIPYRYGVGLHGIGGTGKSTLAAAYAARFGKPIYIINLAGIENDNALVSAFLGMAPSCFVLLEDMDCIPAARKRKPGEPEIALVAPPPPSTPNDKSPEPAKGGITLSGLLNVIDGVAATEGRVLFITSNHYADLDPALVRSARVDREFMLGPLTPPLVGEMASRFFGDEAAADWVTIARALTPRTAAWWQTHFLQELAAGGARLALAA